MRKSIYLINPGNDFSGYHTLDVIGASGFPPAVYIADLSITTVAAMASPHLDVTLCEELVTPVDFDTPFDYVGITGKTTQWGRMRLLAAEFRRRGKVVLLGGPFVSLSPEIARPHCDILVQGEIEAIADTVFSDLASGEWKPHYQGDKPDLRQSPLPRWDLYPNDRAVVGAVQTSRGCPFECEFCDVIQYAGRKQRHKDIDQVLRELDALYGYGYRNVFLVDDNFTAYRAHCKELVTAVRDWNARQADGPVVFSTQLSIDAARDVALLDLLADAGMANVFIGLETPNKESLRETKKRQNVNVNLVEEVETFARHGIIVVGGMVVGFDHDGPDIFERQFEFAMATPIPIWTIGTLVAPAATPLYARKQREGRLREDDFVHAAPWSTNIVPTGMTHDELVEGMKWLCNKLYDPDNFGRRVERFFELAGTSRPADTKTERAPIRLRAATRNIAAMADRVGALGPREQALWDRVCSYARQKPQYAAVLLYAVVYYMQVRYMYARGQFWEPLLSPTQSPTKPREQTVALMPRRQASAEVGVGTSESTLQSLDVWRSQFNADPAQTHAEMPSEEVAELLRALTARDIRLHAEDDRLAVHGPKGALTGELKALLATHKHALLALLAAGKAGGQARQKLHEAQEEGLQ